VRFFPPGEATLRNLRRRTQENFVCSNKNTKEPAEGKKKAKEKGYQLSNRQAEEDPTKNIGRLFLRK